MSLLDCIRSTQNLGERACVASLRRRGLVALLARQSDPPIGYPPLQAVEALLSAQDEASQPMFIARRDVAKQIIALVMTDAYFENTYGERTAAFSAITDVLRARGLFKLDSGACTRK